MKIYIAKYYCAILVVIVYCLTMFSGFSQSKLSDGLKIESNYHQGIILPEFGLLTPIEEDYRRSVEFSLFKQSSVKNYWQQLYNYPEQGLSFYYTSLGHNKVLGQMIGVDYFFRITFLDKNRFKVFNQTGIGLNYVNKRFDEIKNPLNTAISSHYNAHFNLRFGTCYKLSNKYDFNFGVSFDHISNANFSHPNIGVNSVSLFTGMAYDFGSSFEQKSFVVPDHERKINAEIITEIGGWHLDEPKDKYYIIPALTAEFTHETFRLIHFGLGADLIYDETIGVEFEKQGIEFNNSENYLLGVHLSQSLAYNKFRFVTQEGYYLIMPEELVKKQFYHRILFKYYLNTHVSLHLAFKSYLQDLKYVSIGVGYKI